ncbi:MAG: hypothetical protein NTX61_04095 [Bacteroidetes bacterium]|nr:hypothetical protein [Bacteroidota bacterium]
MKELEKFIRENAAVFNDEEPPGDHFERFQRRLEKRDSRGFSFLTSQMFIRIAATILIFLTMSIFIFDYSFHGVKNIFGRESATVVFPQDVRDAIQYYSMQVSGGITKIHQLAASGEEANRLSALVMNEMKILDKNTAELTRSYHLNPNDERITTALIRNQQMKETIVESMIKKIEKQGK